MQRYGEVIKLENNKLDEYVELHNKIWPGIVQKIKKANIQNFSIFYRDGYLFKYFEYTGKDFVADMQKLAEDQENIEWLKLTDPCQVPLSTIKEGQWWAPMEEIFHL